MDDSGVVGSEVGGVESVVGSVVGGSVVVGSGVGGSGVGGSGTVGVGSFGGEVGDERRPRRQRGGCVDSRLAAPAAKALAARWRCCDLRWRMRRVVLVRVFPRLKLPLAA